MGDVVDVLRAEVEAVAGELLEFVRGFLLNNRIELGVSDRQNVAAYAHRLGYDISTGVITIETARRSLTQYVGLIVESECS